MKNKRYLSAPAVWGLAFGCVVGWGSFVMPGTTFLPDAGPLGTVLGIALSALMVLCICYNYSRLAQEYPEGAGSYVYTRNILGEDHAFLAAWSLLLAYISLFWANATAFILIGRYLIGGVLEWGFHYSLAGYDVYFGEVLATLAIMWIFGCISCFGKRLAAHLRTIFAAILFVAVFLLFIGVLKNGGQGMFAPAFSDDEPPAVQVLNIAILAPWLFVGFETVAHSVPESKISVKKCFRMAALAIISGMFVYIFLALIASSARPAGFGSWVEYVGALDGLDGREGIPVIYNAEALLGKAGIALVGIAAFCALATSVLGFHRAASRIIKLMSEGGILPASFAAVNEDAVPVRAGLLVLIISTPIPFIGRTAVGWNADVSTLSVAIVYAYISICALKHARNSFAKAAAVLGVAASALVLFCLLVPNIFSHNALAKESYLMLAVWSLLGILYYRHVFKHDADDRFGKSTVMWLMMLFMLFFSANVWVRLDMQEKLFGTAAAPDAALLRGSMIQLAIIVAALLIMYSLFSIMMKREKEKERRIIEAEAQNKAKTDFLSNMSHDIRTPMNAIIGFTDLALMDTENVEAVEGHLRKIKASGAHLLSLINDVLDMSRIESGRIELNPEPVNLGELMENLQSIVAGQAEEKKQLLSVEYKDITDRMVMVDRLRLNQVLLNLVSNAIKYTQEEGRIRVSLSQVAPAAENKAEYRISVKDNGMGMTPEFAEKVFDAFERERNSTVSGIQGTGLGMAITKRIVDMMEGEIAVDTKLGAGTEFVVKLELPLCDEAQLKKETEKEVAAENRVAGGLSGQRLLLVDDMMINRQLAKAMLELSGFEVEEAENGEEAVNKVKEAEAGYYAAVLMDIQMPKMNGYEASRAIRALSDDKKKSVPIIAMTANAFDEDKKNAKDAGMNAHLAKPIDREKLLKLLSELM